MGKGRGKWGRGGDSLWRLKDWRGRRAGRTQVTLKVVVRSRSWDSDSGAGTSGFDAAPFPRWVGELGQRARWQLPEPLCLAPLPPG